MDLVDRVRRTIRRGSLAGPATRVVAAVSGGPDSVALVHLLRGLDVSGELQLVGLAHFNHQLRPEADADQQFCVEMGRDLRLPIVIDTADVGRLARQEQCSIEAAARTVRHAFFERARVELAAAVVALGHTRDDQAETYLLRLLRGAGSQGLASMHPRKGAIIRPLLECRRGELIAYLAALGAAFVEDGSNADLSIPRNRVRAELIPFLAARFNPSVVDALAGGAEVARQDWAWMNGAADALERRAVLEYGNDFGSVRNQNREQSRIQDRTPLGLTLDAAPLSAAPVAVARAVLRRVMTRAAAGRFIGFDAVERALELSHGIGADFDAPGQRVQRIGSTIVLTGRPRDAIGRPTVSNQIGAFRYALSIPGEVELSETGSVISAEEPGSMELGRWSSGAVDVVLDVVPKVESSRGEAIDADPGSEQLCNPMQMRRSTSVLSMISNASASANAAVMVRRDLCGAQLAVRNRRPGDRFRLAGAAGRKKLQDFFVDRKIDRRQRDLVPLVVDETDRIVWVAGHAVNADFRVTDPAQAVIILRLKGVGGAV